jgi:hypothetical protein
MGCNEEDARAFGDRRQRRCPAQTRAKQSDAAAPASRRVSGQRPDPAPLPPPAGAAAGERAAIAVVGCRQRVSGPAPMRAEQSDAAAPPPCRRCRRPAAAARTSWLLRTDNFLCGNWAEGANEAGGWYIFFDNGTNTTLCM